MNLSLNFRTKSLFLFIGILVGIFLIKAPDWLHYSSVGHKTHDPFVSQQIQEQVYAKYGTDRFRKVKYNHHDVPPFLHFIWISKHLSGPEHLPKRVLKNIKSWEKLHPKDQIILWTNAMVRRHFPKLVPLLSKIKTESWIANLLRYKILSKYGGVYLDTDIIAFKNIDHLRKKTHGFTVCESPRNFWPSATLTESSCSSACNAVIAARPQQAALIETFHKALKNTQNKFDTTWFPLLFKLNLTRYHTKFSGPPLWTKFVIKNHFKILKAQTFFPCDWKERSKCIADNFRNQPNIFAMHTWEKSW